MEFNWGTECAKPLRLAGPRFMCPRQPLDDGPMSPSISSNDTNLLKTPQIIHDVFTLAEIYFLQRIANLDFLVFDHTTEVSDM